MPTPTIADYLKYANLQMAAEAFIRDEKTKLLASAGQPLIDALVAGNNHASKFTASEANKFAADWEVLDQETSGSESICLLS